MEVPTESALVALTVVLLVDDSDTIHPGSTRIAIPWLVSGAARQPTETHLEGLVIPALRAFPVLDALTLAILTDFVCWPRPCRHRDRDGTPLSVEPEIVEGLSRWASRLGTHLASGAGAGGHRLFTYARLKGVTSRWVSGPGEVTWVDFGPARVAHASALAELAGRASEAE